MEKVLIFLSAGLFLGASFVEATRRLAKGRLLWLYIISLPIKLTLWAFAFYLCYLFGSILGLFSAMGGFLMGFVAIVLREFLKDGRPESA
ncbi:MAG: hypothetical protein RMK75_04340 [Aquificaceae bacterium]|nr:hypothetical protein [Aquificaceae bacterium]MDW8423537.1 hypothetical protein [Aquificaceae bacterium]